MNLKAKLLKKTTVSSYSSRNSSVYDDPMNKNFVYGEITIDFVNRIKLQKTDEIIADIGCGTGFAFDIMYDRIKKNNSKCFGIEPAKGMLKLAKEKLKSELQEKSTQLTNIENEKTKNKSVSLIF